MSPSPSPVPQMVRALLLFDWETTDPLRVIAILQRDVEFPQTFAVKARALDRLPCLSSLIGWGPLLGRPSTVRTLGQQGAGASRASDRRSPVERMRPTQRSAAGISRPGLAREFAAALLALPELFLHRLPQLL